MTRRDGRVVGFDVTDDGRGVEVTDYVERHSATIQTDCEVSFTQSDPGSFVAPLDDAVAFYASELRLPNGDSYHVRGEDGEHHMEAGYKGSQEFPLGTYYVEGEVGFKVYVRVFEASMFVESNTRSAELHLSFEEETRVEVGARSNHERPAATVTVSDEPRDVLEAVAYLGSGVKEWSPERSWPTVRGHPPRIERGDELHVPDGLRKPDTGVTVDVPLDRADIYRVAPLATYLGATPEPIEGGEVRLHLANGYDEPLGRGRELERRVSELVAKCLFLDSLVRIGGYYDLDRYEYDAVASDLHFYPPELYDASLSEQLMEYLGVSFETVEPYLPTWPPAGVLHDDPEDVELLPFLSHRLAHVRVRESEQADGEPSRTVAVAGEHDEESWGKIRLSGTAYENALETPVTASAARFIVSNAPAALHAARTVANSYARTESTVEAGDTDSDPLETGADCIVIDSLRGRSPREIQGRDLSPAVVVSATPVAVEVAAALVDAGVCAVVGVSGDEAGAGRIAGYLTIGLTVSDAVRFAAPEAPVTVTGVPDRPVVSKITAQPWHVDVTSRGIESHDFTLESFLAEEITLGSIIIEHDEPFGDTHRLAGARVPHELPVDTDSLLDVLRSEQTVVTLNGERVHDVSKLTPEFVRASARRSLEERHEGAEQNEGAEQYERRFGDD